MEGITRDVAMSLTVAAGGSLGTNDRLDYPMPYDTKKNEQLNDDTDSYMYNCRFFGMFKSDTSVVDEVIAIRRQNPRG